jgi:Flp pilus assembly pilin Flp
MYVKFLVAYADLRDRLDRQEGQALVEYALILTFVAIAAIVALQAMGHSVTAIFTNMANDL